VFAAWTVDLYRQLRGYFRPMVTTITKSEDGKKLEQPIQPLKTVYDIIGVILAAVTFNFGMLPFVGLSLENSWSVWRRFYFFGIFGALLFQGALLALPLLFPGKREKGERGDKKRDD